MDGKGAFISEGQRIKLQKDYTKPWSRLCSLKSQETSGGGGGLTRGVILVRVCMPVFWNQPQSYNHIPGLWKNSPFIYLISQKIYRLSYTVLWINIPFHTKSMCNGCQKIRAIHIFSFLKRGFIIYLAVLKMGLFGTHICTMLYIGSYPPPPPPPQLPPPRARNGKKSIFLKMERRNVA